MNEATLKAAVAEAERFLTKAKALTALIAADQKAMQRKRDGGEKHVYPADFPKEQGAVKRASMDLTRALADLRRPG